MNVKNSAAEPPRIKLALLSCGLGNVYRGFEVSTGRWFDALSKETSLDVRLFAGGNYPGATTIWNIHRDSLFAGKLNFWPHLWMRRRWEISYGIEQITYALSFLPELLAWRPDVVWLKEAPLAHILAAYRSIFNLKFKIIFANGGAFKPQTYQPFDYIQHLVPESIDMALESGLTTDKMRLLCNTVPVPDPPADRGALRRSLGYCDSDWVILCVAAFNRHHKRIDYLIEEVAAMNDPHVRLLLCGHPEPETALLKVFAQEKLGSAVQWITLPGDQMGSALYAADIFVLPSLDECLGGASIEAAMAALPVISHPHSGARFVLQDEYWMSDLSQCGNLTERLRWFRNNSVDPQKLRSLQHRILDTFDERAMCDEFCDMVQGVLGRRQLDLVTAQ